MQFTWFVSQHKICLNMISFPRICKCVSFQSSQPSRPQDPSLYWKSGSESISLCLSNFDSYLRWLSARRLKRVDVDRSIGRFKKTYPRTNMNLSTNVTSSLSTLPSCRSCCQRNNTTTNVSSKICVKPSRPDLRVSTRRAAASCSHGCFVAPLFWEHRHLHQEG